jgi:hypothetical protein
MTSAAASTTTPHVSRVRVAQFDTVDDVPGTLWASVTPDDFFFDLRFLRVMSESGVEAARYRYLVLYADDRPIGAAVLSRFTLRLDLLSGDPWIARVRRLAPFLLDVPMVCCGIPASFGQHHLHVTQEGHLREAARAVHLEMERWAEESGCGLVLWKEWSPSQALREIVDELGYVVLPTLPDHLVGPLPTTVEDFVARMRSSYRRKFRTAVALVRDGASAQRRTSGRVVLDHAPLDDPEAFHRGYASVMDRTPVRLERYPLAFFERLAASSLETSVLTVRDTERGHSISALIIPGGSTLTFALASKERARHEASLYTVLLQTIVLHGIGSGYRTVRLGQTSDYAKCSVGARPVRLETFIRMRAPWKHRLVRHLGSNLFPEPTSPRLRVFREPAP